MKEKLKQFGIWAGKALGIVALNTSTIVMGVSLITPSREYKKGIEVVNSYPITQEDKDFLIKLLSDNKMWEDYGMEGQISIIIVSLICLMITYGVIKFFFMEKRADKRSKEQTKSLADTIKSL